MNVIVTVDAAPSTMESLARRSSVIAIGTFDSYRDPQWNTPGGQRPVTVADRNRSFLVYRPVIVTQATILRGDASSLAHARLQGGDIGCDREQLSGGPNLVAGTRYVLFLEPPSDTQETGISDPWLLEAWPISADDTVQTALEGDVALSALRDVIAATPYQNLPGLP